MPTWLKVLLIVPLMPVIVPFVGCVLLLIVTLMCAAVLHIV